MKFEIFFEIEGDLVMEQLQTYMVEIESKEEIGIYIRLDHYDQSPESLQKLVYDSLVANNFTKIRINELSEKKIIIERCQPTDGWQSPMDSPPI